ncbi:MAG: DUF885 domain-containing protein [Idiomarina sp.]|nr:DUF885 domain-containing protein [Idiomarina sp.]
MRTLLSILLGLFLVACQPSGPAPETSLSESERLNTWFDEQYELLLLDSPMQLTMLGRKERYDEFDDMSLAGQQAQADRMAQLVRTMEREFDYDQLDQETQTSWDLFKFATEQELANLNYAHHHYHFNQMRSPHTSLVQFMISFHRVDEPSDMDAYISRLIAAEQVLNQILVQAQSNAENGVRPPRFAHETVIRETRRLLTGQPFDSSEHAMPLWQDALGKIEQLVDQEKIDDAQAEAYREQVRTALTQHLKPAYERMLAFLEADIEHAPVNSVGVSRHPQGDAFYRHMLQVNTTTDLSAAEIHQIGLSEVARLRGEMQEVQQAMGFAGTFEEYFEFMRTDEQFFYPNTDEGRQAYLDDSTAYLDKISERLPEFFGILPKADLEVRRVESFREQDGAPQHYSRGSPDGSRPGVYYAHLSDMTAMPKTDLEAVAYHEGNPGHHMQISIAQELEGIPRFRTQMGFTVYVEGWALYSELLAKEMGGYQELYSEFGRLGAEIWRAVRLVVDTGMHAKGWTEEQAFEYFMANVPTTAPGARAEIQRYLVLPGQATSYKIGMLRIQELRAEAEAALGDTFDIRGFHDTVLGGGALPLPLLERRVQQWIARQQGN